jgi:hypothetical protein
MHLGMSKSEKYNLPTYIRKMIVITCEIDK